MLFRSNDTATTEIYTDRYTLSLHDALPISEDLPRNPPNSPAHSSTETRHPTTTGSPQYLNIWFMSSEPSSKITPSVPSAGGNHTITAITPPDPLYSRRFQCDEEILEELQCPDSPWDALHHHALFLP